MNRLNRSESRIVLADGAVFEGVAIGAKPAGGITTGEFVFNTVLSGYQEVISDPSYAGQVIAFTYPHIGNYGVNSSDNESFRPHCSGVVVRDLPRLYSNYRAEGSLEDWLIANGIPGIAGVDTRRLTRHIRDHGALPGVFGTAALDELKDSAAKASGTEGIDLVARVSDPSGYTVQSTNGGERRIVAMDLGIKSTIVSQLAQLGSVHVVPASTTTEEVLELTPTGLFLSNGPGDPSAVAGVSDVVGELLGEVPIFGICMGQQMLATALGATTFKLPFGHHGGNQPVEDLATGRTEITSQNHNYCVDADSMDGIEVTHRNLNDGTLEGFKCVDQPAFAVQYHPEAGPGPHDSRYLFERFAQLMDTGRPL